MLERDHSSLGRGGAARMESARRRPVAWRSAAAALALALALGASPSCATAPSAQREAELAAACERLEAALRDGDDAAARAAAARIRELDARGADARRAEELVRLLDARVEPRFEPALLALRAALADGDPAQARAILARLLQLQPSGTALELARVYERILDGRAALSLLELETQCLWRPDPQVAGAGTCVVRLAVRSRDGAARALVGGAATLELAAVTLDARGHHRRAGETRALEAPARIEVPAQGPAEADLALVPLELPDGALALRLTARVLLRSGSVVEQGRALPARPVAAAAGELVLLEGRLLALGPAARGDLAAAALQPASRPEDLLALALRVRREDRDAVLDAVAGLDLDRGRIERLAPALRWLAPEAGGGSDVAQWDEWLDARAAARRAAERSTEPVLPRAGRAKLAGP
ncbi:MAG: hypothetical protein JNK02_15315 [Planctomycetes bacterium]|nr:hypothetical protein [Planctomycetota bacterium]